LHLLILCLFQNLLQLVKSQCQCSGLSAAPSITVPSNYVGENEIVNGINYGIPNVLNGMVFLPQDVGFVKSTSMLNASCPYDGEFLQLVS